MPDFDFRDSVLAAVSSGAAGSTLGARLHIFSAAPRRLAAQVTLPEIVIDEGGFRLSRPRGLKLAGRTASVVVDTQRVLQCTVG